MFREFVLNGRFAADVNVYCWQMYVIYTLNASGGDPPVHQKRKCLYSTNLPKLRWTKYFCITRYFVFSRFFYVSNHRLMLAKHEFSFFFIAFVTVLHRTRYIKIDCLISLCPHIPSILANNCLFKWSSISISHWPRWWQWKWTISLQKTYLTLNVKDYCGTYLN